MIVEHHAQYNIHDAKTNLSRIIERVEHGEEIIISRSGTPVARVVPLSPRVHRTARGSLRGTLAAGFSYVGPRPLPYGARSDTIATLDASATLGWWFVDLSISAQNLLNRQYRLGEYNYVSDFHTTPNPTRCSVRSDPASSTDASRWSVLSAAIVLSFVPEYVARPLWRYWYCTPIVKYSPSARRGVTSSWNSGARRRETSTGPTSVENGFPGGATRTMRVSLWYRR